jgi:hypothetical protein
MPKVIVSWPARPFASMIAARRVQAFPFQLPVEHAPSPGLESAMSAVLVTVRAGAA